MHPREIRTSFLKYFEKHGHRVVASSPLLPGDDPTLLFTNAGMNQFKDVFLGREKRDYSRAATSQKCMRVSGKHNDLDNVGPSLRHHTFFEMLGNFSFGDYFKHDAIELAWNLLTKEWGLDPAKLYVTVFKGEKGIPRDDEGYQRWLDFVPADHIGELGMADNFWAMGDTGPCGRCSEIYVDRGASLAGSGDFVTDVESGSERFVEIWNNVFMEFERDASGTLTPLPAPSIDTGMGLERISAVMQGTTSNYDTPLFMPLLDAIGKMSGHVYNKSMSATDISMRVVADHARASTFLIADGVVPSNEWRGYVLRKIMRRAMRHGRKLGMHEPFLHSLVDVLVREMGDAYPEVTSGRDAIAQVIKAEEERFDAVLTGGLPRLEEVLERAAKSNKTVPGDEAFKLYDSYGLPRDFIEDLASNQGLKFDAEGFDAAMEGQRVKARAGSSFEGKKEEFTFASDQDRASLQQAGDVFEGYTEIHVKGASVLALFDDKKKPVASLNEGASGYAVLAKTPFYVEAGGQISDQGWIETANGGRSRVTGVVRLGPGLPRAHRLENIEQRIAARDIVTAQVDEDRRDATRRNHTGTHLLHAALRRILGNHVKQAGSLVAPDRLRFDFVHFSALTPEERKEVERLVNQAILENAPVNTAVKNTQEAIAAGATALFGEKYGDKVRVVSIGDGAFSTELCGGTHVRATGDIGAFLITEESGVAAGVRRIEAVTGMGAYEMARAAIDEIGDAREFAGPGPLPAWIDQQAKSLGKLQKEIQQLKTKLALGAGGGGATADDKIEINGSTLIARRVDDVDSESLRTLADTLKSRLKSGIVILAAPMPEGKVSLIVTVTPDLAKKAPAGQLVKTLAPIVGGGGGGRPDFAQAGGKDASKITELLAAAQKTVVDLLS
ncbi:MAG TPA: alanine--tRNA ligase [Vicinamibacterales bacterium]|nr:alanine--tRNA ligase [Vicinamibacterales bacterium]